MAQKPHFSAAAQHLHVIAETRTLAVLINANVV